MKRRVRTFLTAATAILTVAGASPSFAASDCQQMVVAKGFPNRMKTVARLSAMRLWTQRVELKHGSDFAMWHNAYGSALRCVNVDESAYIMCIAKGQPCKADVE